MKVRKCRFPVACAARIERLVERVISYSLRANPASLTPTRSAVLRALVQMGLRLADTREFSRDDPMEKSRTVVLSYRASDEEIGRFERTRERLAAHSLFGAEPERADVERMIVRLALNEAETLASFPAFMRLVWAAQRSSRGSPDPAGKSA